MEQNTIFSSSLQLSATQASQSVSRKSISLTSNLPAYVVLTRPWYVLYYPCPKITLISTINPVTLPKCQLPIFSSTLRTVYVCLATYVSFLTAKRKTKFIITRFATKLQLPKIVATGKALFLHHPILILSAQEQPRKMRSGQDIMHFQWCQ